MPNRRGFTLIELAMVVMIIGFAGAVAAPRYAASLAKYRLDAAARRIAADLALAQTVARSTSVAQPVVFDATAMTYQLTGVTALNNVAANYLVKLADEPYRVSIGSVSFGGAAQVSFNLYGVPASGGTVVIKAGSGQRTLTLDATTGQVSIQ